MADPDPKTGITPDPDPKGGAPTPEPKPAAKIEMTQEELDKKMQERQARGEAAATKKLQKTIDDLQAKIADFEGKDLGELEKLQRKVEKLSKDLTDKDAELTGLKLKDAKINALLSAGAASAQISKLLKRVSGTTPEEIESDVKELTELGWIGKAPEPDPSKPAANGSGKPPVKDGIKKFTEAQLRAMKPEEYEANRADILKAMEGGLIQK